MICLKPANIHNTMYEIMKHLQVLAPDSNPGFQCGPVTDESELHFSEPWFHRTGSSRTKAEELLRKNAHLGDGTFLVRPSECFVGSYSLSFLRKGEVIAF